MVGRARARLPERARHTQAKPADETLEKMELTCLNVDMLRDE